jgi:hypothetical protein
MIIASNELKREQGKKGAIDFCRKFAAIAKTLPEAFKIAEARAALYSPRSTDKAGNWDMITGNFPR